jgi:hypothetical protein
VFATSGGLPDSNAASSFALNSAKTAAALTSTRTSGSSVGATALLFGTAEHRAAVAALRARHPFG